MEVSINVLTGEFQRLDAKEVTLVLSKPDSGIEPFKRQAVRLNEGTWSERFRRFLSNER
ncbi:hypothetical protein [Sinorhizobium fredii]|uniref:hypothetical protein n=1 Tax=Rhizobium fredii TaxID=380 RepID=UPI0004BB300B|nr:hypothetical protein [Sinorhizobium fredii]